MDNSAWYAVRCIFAISVADGEVLYEERVTLWKAAGTDDAIRHAEADAADYAADLRAEYLGLAQAYSMPDEPMAGAEIFSLVRTSTLPPREYLTSFFDTGSEHQEGWARLPAS